MDSDEEEDKLAEQVANLVYSSGRDETDINYDHYLFSVNQKFDFSTRNLSYKKYKYIRDEILLDLDWSQRHTLAFKSTILIIIFLFFVRIFVHYIGQYTILAMMQVPVTKYEQQWFRVELVYAAWAFWQEVFVVCTGAAANGLFFFIMVMGQRCITSCWNCYPAVYYKILSWYGMYAFLDPIFTLFFDLCYQAWDGDMFKFYNYFLGLEGNGGTGIFITLFLVGGIMMLSGRLFYTYMVFIYMDGRILDLYRRLSGSYKSFFLPHDNEVSLKYLQWVLERYRTKDCIIMSELRVLKDKFGNDRNINFVHIHRIEDGKIQKNRLFFKDFDGSIQEVP